MTKHKERIRVGGEERWVSAATKQELHLSIARILLENGELNQYMRRENERDAPTVREFIGEV